MQVGAGSLCRSLVSGHEVVTCQSVGMGGIQVAGIHTAWYVWAGPELADAKWRRIPFGPIRRRSTGSRPGRMCAGGGHARQDNNDGDGRDGQPPKAGQPLASPLPDADPV